jgi:hypothetical protein
VTLPQKTRPLSNDENGKNGKDFCGQDNSWKLADKSYLVRRNRTAKQEP